LRIEKSAYSMMWEALAIFMLLVIMLAVLRIEQNTNFNKPKRFMSVW
jgi:hypothetical protein